MSHSGKCANMKDLIKSSLNKDSKNLELWKERNDKNLSIYQENVEKFKEIKKIFRDKSKHLLESLISLAEANEEIGIDNENSKEDYSPASIQTNWDVNWYTGDKIYDHVNTPNNKYSQFNLFTSEEALPNNYEVHIKLIKNNHPGYTVIGLCSSKILKSAHYLGDNETGPGSIGFGNSGYVACEGVIIDYSQKINKFKTLKNDDIITIKGNLEMVTFLVNNEFAFEYTFKNKVDEFYLAANCYYDDIIQIL